MRRLLCAALMSLGLVASAAGAADAELERHRERWNAAGASDYVYAYRKHCECHRDAPPETVVRVSDGEITRVHHEHQDSDREVPARDGSLDLYWTIDALFDLLERAYEAGAEVRVRYDAELGLPRELHVDYDAELVGDEVDLRVTRFEARTQ